MIIAVGSQNPVKIGAVRQVTSRVWPSATVISAAVESGISPMPMSTGETLLGAENRARQALAQTAADLAVGLEGGVDQEPAGFMLLGWVVIVDAKGRRGIGGTPRIPLPEKIAARVRAGEELGTVMDDLMKERNIKQKGGAVGALTAGLLLREDAFAAAVAFALSPFITPELH